MPVGLEVSLSKPLGMATQGLLSPFGLDFLGSLNRFLIAVAELVNLSRTDTIEFFRLLISRCN